MILVFVVTFYLLPVTFYFQFSPYKGKEYYRNKQTKRQLFSLLFFKGELSCPYIKGHELQARASIYSFSRANCSHTPLSRTLPLHLLMLIFCKLFLIDYYLEGRSCKLAPARGLKDTSYKLAPAWGLLLEGTSYKLAPAWATFLYSKSKNMKAPRG